MRIAFSGSHRVGKTTLLETVANALPGYATVDEPYALLEEEGYEFSETPSLEEFEAQLERSLVTLEQPGELGDDVLLDRCPADLLAYLLVHEDAESFEPEDWLERIRDAMSTLDFVVFVPIESRDVIPLGRHDDRDYRLAVHEKLHHLLLDDPFGFDADILTVEGDLSARRVQVLARVRRVLR